MNEIFDNEKNPTLRAWREKLGYGLGWTFKDALWQYLQGPVTLGTFYGIMIYLFVHTRMVVSLSWAW